MHRVAEAYERLLAHYGPQSWWPAKTAFEVIVGALLMQQTAWGNVEAAIRNLRRARLLDVRRLAAASLSEVRGCVRVAGLYRTKPARLRAFSRHLLDRADGDLDAYFRRPTDAVRADLLAQPGIGPETADSILLYAGGHPVFVVDAYTVRIASRLGVVRGDGYDRVARAFTRRLPKDPAVYQECHALLVSHAKAFCRPRPRCDACPLLRICDHGRRRKG